MSDENTIVEDLVTAPLTPEMFIELVPMSEPQRTVGRIWKKHTMLIDNVTLDWLGYIGSYNVQRRTFRRMLQTTGIEYETVSSTDSISMNKWPEIACDGRGRPIEWLVVRGEDFKIACLRANTKRVLDIARFYGVLEYSFRAYGIYIAKYHADLSTRKHNNELALLDEKHTSEHSMQSLRVKSNHENELAILYQKHALVDQKHAAERNSSRRENDAMRAKRNEITTSVAASRKRMGAMLQQLRAKSARFVPAPTRSDREECVAVVKMSDAYIPVETDPLYVRKCDVIFVRSQRGLLSRRMCRLRHFGNNTNVRAEIMHQVKTANARALYARFVERTSESAEMISLTLFGGQLIGDSMDDVIALLVKTEAEKYKICDDDDDDDIDYENDGLGDYYALEDSEEDESEEGETWTIMN